MRLRVLLVNYDSPKILVIHFIKDQNLNLIETRSSVDAHPQ